MAQSSERKINFKSLVSYGIGDLYGGGSFLIISTLFLFFLTDVVGLRPALAGLVVFGGKFWDAVSDPLMGCISDRTKSKYGRRRLYFLIGIVPVFISFFLLWISFKSGSEFLLFLYYFFAYVLFCTVYTMVMVPYSSLPAEMSLDYKERTRLSGARMIFSQLSSIISGVVPGMLVNNLYKDNPRMGFLLVGIIFGLFYAMPWYFVFKGTWELPEAEQNMPSSSLSKAFSDMRTLFRVRSFRIHIGMYILGYSALDVLSALFVYYLTHHIGARGYYTACLGTMLISQLIVLPLYLFIANRLGKGKAYMIGAAIVVVIGSLFYGIPAGAPLSTLMLLSAGLGFGLSAIVAMPWAMLPESADADELVNGLQRAGSVAGSFTLIRKLVQALVLWLVGILLAAIGYTANTQASLETIQGIRLFFSFGPTTLVLLGGALALLYPITPKTNAIMRTELTKRHEGTTAPQEMLSQEARSALAKIGGHVDAQP